MFRFMTANTATALKYLMRFPYKGTPIEDVKKAEFYLKDENKFPFKWSMPTEVAAEVDQNLRRVVSAEPNRFVATVINCIRLYLLHQDSRHLSWAVEEMKAVIYYCEGRYGNK